MTCWSLMSFYFFIFFNVGTSQRCSFILFDHLYTNFLQSQFLLIRCLSTASWCQSWVDDVILFVWPPLTSDFGLCFLSFSGFLSYLTAYFFPTPGSRWGVHELRFEVIPPMTSCCARMTSFRRSWFILISAFRKRKNVFGMTGIRTPDLEL